MHTIIPWLLNFVFQEFAYVMHETGHKWHTSKLQGANVSYLTQLSLSANSMGEGGVLTI